MSRVSLTNKFVERLSNPTSGQTIYWDTQLKRLGLRVGVLTKAFICEKKQNGKSVRVTIGTYPTIDVHEARKRASKILMRLSDGVNIRQEERIFKLKTTTLLQLYEDYIETKSNLLRVGTVMQYRNAVISGYKDWLNLEIRLITKDMIETRHKKFKIERGAAQANKFGGTLKTLFNFAIKKYEIDGVPLILFNPVDRLSELSLWYPKVRRTGHLKPHHLKALFRVMNCGIMDDYLRFVLFTGVRRREATSLKWSDISIENKSFFVRDSKNHNPLELPMSEQLMHVIRRRLFTRQNEFIFPSGLSVSGHIEEPKKRVLTLGKMINYHFTIHDLRRTFITIAESIDVSQYTIKALVNHRMSYSSDVTSGYVVISLERLRSPMQLISDYISKYAED